MTLIARLYLFSRLTIITVALLGLVSAKAGADESLFNGRDLAGWKGDPRLWRVENGVLVGETDESDRKIGRNSFLILEETGLSDFELVLTARILGDNNSGVQYRSRVVDEDRFSVHGYQMDMHPHQPYNAMLFEEGGRGILCQRGQAVIIDQAGQRTLTPLKEGLPEADMSEWNEYRLVARGPVTEHYLNGTLAARIEDRETGKSAKTGVIALQLHAGPPMRAEFKDIRLKRLVADSPAQPAAESEAKPLDGENKTSWIWSQERAGANEEIFLRRTIAIPEAVTEARLVVTCDNHFQLFLDGKSIAEGSDWNAPEIRDLSSLLSRPGERTFAVQARNEGGPAGFAFRLELTLDSGEKQVLVSDEQWKWTAGEESGWQGASHDASAWRSVVTLGEMGVDPWGDVFAGAFSQFNQTAVDVTAHFDVMPGFRLERIYEVPKAKGSWVALTVDGKGHIIAADQYGQLFEIIAPPIGNTETPARVRALDLPVFGAHGLLWAHDSLYVVTGEKNHGVDRITDSNGDGELDHVERLKTLIGGGEHGPHGMALSPDGEWIYMVAGNYTLVPDVDQSLVPPVWEEDQLLPRRPDARGHAHDKMAPGGWIARFTPEGDRWELVSSGYRNAYGIAFNHRGDLFTFDSDMEWDLGTPWYRPTRIVHATSGSEFGWRNGTGKWPDYYEDSLPPTLDVGPGSPTGVVAGTGLKFPARYQHALFMLDWTFATIYAVQLTPDGASYSATTEELVAGAGLPVTDTVVGADGALYFAVGGRRTDSALYRVTYIGSESTAPEPPPATPASAERLTTLRLELEELHQIPNPIAIEKIWQALGHDDRFICFAARTALEHLPLNVWKARLESETDSWRTILAAMAVARIGTAEDQKIAIEALARIHPIAHLKESQLINLMRAYGLVFARHGKPDEALRHKLEQRFDPIYPATSDHINRELCRLLVYLESPAVVTKTLRLMASAPSTPAPAWAELASRNARYGSAVLQMIENMPPAQNMFYAYCLRAYEGPWTEGQRRQLFTWFGEAEMKSGGASYRGFINDLRQKTLSRATPEEREMIESWDLKAAVSPFANLPTPKGPGRAWTLEEAVAAAEKGLEGRDRLNGKKMYHATLCAACHRFEGEGGGGGPDLTAVAGRFSIRDLLEAIIHPEQTISDQYRFDLITMTDGSTMTGKIVEDRGESLSVATSAFDFSQRLDVPRDRIESIETSPNSPMPPALINRLNEEELRDLLAYLLNRN